MIRDGLVWLSLALAAVGCLYVLTASVLVRRYASRAEPSRPEPAPSVTVLKPLHGAESGLFGHLEGLCRQDYPGPVQIVCGVADPDDPAVGMVEALRAAYPAATIDLVRDPRRAGANAKISNVVNMAPLIRHDVVLLSDSDIAVPPDHLSRVVAALAEPGVAGVTCLYRGEAGPGPWSRLNAMGIDSHFLPNVVVGLSAGLARPCFGSTTAFRRDLLPAIDDFKSLANDLADDYTLGSVLRAHGRVVVPPYAVAHACIEPSLSALWHHEVRWLRTIRTVDPMGYAGSVVTHPFPFAILSLSLGGGWPATALAVLALGGRFLLCRAVARSFGAASHPFWLVPLRDLLSFAVFMRACFGGAVRWRSDLHDVARDGTLSGRKTSD